ncbi:hypothetical protein GCM10008966_18460 [Rhodovulum strictum]
MPAGGLPLPAGNRGRRGCHPGLAADKDEGRGEDSGCIQRDSLGQVRAQTQPVQRVDTFNLKIAIF